MTRIEKIKAWLAAYPGFDILGSFRVDYADQIGASAIEGGVLPAGLVEEERRQDILGNTTVTNQCNFAIYRRFPQPQEGAAETAPDTAWVAPFRKWVQAQSISGAVPAMGETGPGRETAVVGPGVLYRDNRDGAATYLVTLTIKFKERYEV